MFSGIFDVTSTPRQVCTDENHVTAQKQVTSSVRKTGRKPLADCTPRLKKNLFSSNRVNDTNQINYEIYNCVKPEMTRNRDFKIKNYNFRSLNEHCFRIPQDDKFIIAEPEVVPPSLIEPILPGFEY